MTDFLTILIDLILIWAVSKRPQVKYITTYVPHKLYPKIKGKLEHVQMKAALSEKMAERAFNIASAANLGVVALQKSLSVPKIMTKPVAQRNVLAKEEVDKLFTTEGNFDFLRPILSDEELAVLDKIEEEKYKNGAS